VTGLAGVTAIASGYLHNLALKPNGTVLAWGYNAKGQLGNGTAIDQSVPIEVPGLTDISGIAGGGYHSLALQGNPGPKEVLAEAIAAINALGTSTFRNANNKNALANKLNAVLADIEAGLYVDALSKLKNDVLKKTDGCAATGAPDATDWIKDCVAQGEVYVIIMDAIALLQALV